MLPFFIYNRSFLTVFRSSDITNNFNPLTGSYRKSFPSALGLPPTDVSHPVSESTSAFMLQTSIPRTSMSATYPTSQKELAMPLPDASGPTPWDQQYYNNLWMHSTDGLDYSNEHDICKSYWKRSLSFFLTHNISDA